MLTKEGNSFTFQNKVLITEQGSSVIITGSAAMNALVNDGGKEKLNEELMTMLTSNASSMYVSLTNIPEDILSSTSPVVSANIKTSEIEDIYITGTNTSETVTSGKFVVRFKNKSENSLVTLTRISKKFAEAMKEIPVAATIDPQSSVEIPTEEAVN